MASLKDSARRFFSPNGMKKVWTQEFKGKVMPFEWDLFSTPGFLIKGAIGLGVGIAVNAVQLIGMGCEKVGTKIYDALRKDDAANASQSIQVQTKKPTIIYGENRTPQAVLEGGKERTLTEDEREKIIQERQSLEARQKQERIDKANSPSSSPKPTYCERFTDLCRSAVNSAKAWVR